MIVECNPTPRGVRNFAAWLRYTSFKNTSFTMTYDDQIAIKLLSPLGPAIPVMTRLVMCRQITIPSLSAAFVSIDDDLAATVPRIFGNTSRGLESLILRGLNSEVSVKILNRGRAQHAQLTIPHDDFVASMCILVTSVTEWLEAVEGRDVSMPESRVLAEFFCRAGDAIGISGLPNDNVNDYATLLRRFRERTELSIDANSQRLYVAMLRWEGAHKSWVASNFSAALSTAMLDHETCLVLGLRHTWKMPTWTRRSAIRWITRRCTRIRARQMGSMTVSLAQGG